MQIKVDKLGLPILNQFSDDGFVDCIFQVKNLIRENDQYRFHLASSFNGEIVGINVRVVKGIKAAFNENDENLELIKEHVYYKGVEFIRSGDESDRLICAMAQLYELELQSTSMVDSIFFTAIVLHQGEIDVETDAVKIKLFSNDAETDSEDDYFESFLNLHFPDGLVAWNEKDPDYRKPLLSSLSTSRN